MKSPLEIERGEFSPVLPNECTLRMCVKKGEHTKGDAELQEHFPNTLSLPPLTFQEGNEKASTPLKVGVLFSGGQAAGGHNVISALFDALTGWHKDSRLIGFLGGPGGLVDNKHIAITKELVAEYRNQGGFTMIGSGRTKIESTEQFTQAAAICKQEQLDGLVIIGGDDSNTNAALLAEDFITRGLTTKVVGVPKTIDGDLRNEYIECSFGFDTATKVYSELIGNLGKDALSAKKYTHFVKLMGRSASHVTLECALKTQPNYAIIAEEVQAKGWTLQEIVKQIADLVEERSRQGKNYGLILVPEGLIEFIPECTELIQELNQKLAESSENVVDRLSEKNKILFSFLPEAIQKQLLYDRDPHGNVQVSHIETEKLLTELTQAELEARKFSGKFSPLHHFFGYEGRSGFPSNFDANYCYALGFVAFTLIKEGCSGYIAALQNLHRPSTEWKVAAAPLVQMIHLEERKGRRKCVIAKKLVDLADKPFQTFAQKRDSLRLKDEYLSPGPIQFQGKSASLITETLSLEK